MPPVYLTLSPLGKHCPAAEVAVDATALTPLLCQVCVRARARARARLRARLRLRLRVRLRVRLRLP